MNGVCFGGYIYAKRTFATILGVEAKVEFKQFCHIQLPRGEILMSLNKIRQAVLSNLGKEKNFITYAVKNEKRKLNYTARLYVSLIRV